MCNDYDWNIDFDDFGYAIIVIVIGFRKCNDCDWNLYCDDFGRAIIVIVIGFRRPAGQIVYKVRKSVASHRCKPSYIISKKCSTSSYVYNNIQPSGIDWTKYWCDIDVHCMKVLKSIWGKTHVKMKPLAKWVVGHNLWQFFSQYKPLLKQYIFIIFHHYLPWSPFDRIPSKNNVWPQ